MKSAILKSYKKGEERCSGGSVDGKIITDRQAEIRSMVRVKPVGHLDPYYQNRNIRIGRYYPVRYG